MSSELSGLDIYTSLLVNSIYPVFVHRCGWLLPPAGSTSYLEAPFKAEHAAGEQGREGAHIEAERKSVRTQNREEKRTAECRGGRAGGEERRD